MKYRKYKDILLNSMLTLFKEGWEFVRSTYSTKDDSLSFHESEVQPYSEIWNGSPEVSAIRSQIRDLHFSRLEFEHLYSGRAPRNATEARKLLKINSTG